MELDAPRKLAVTYWLSKRPTSSSWSIVRDKYRDSALRAVVAFFGWPFTVARVPIKFCPCSSLLSSAPTKGLARVPVLFCRTWLPLADIPMLSATVNLVLSLTHMYSVMQRTRWIYLQCWILRSSLRRRGFSLVESCSLMDCPLIISYFQFGKNL